MRKARTGTALPHPAEAAALRFRIGGVSIAIAGRAPGGEEEIPPSYAPFIEDGPPDVRLRLHRGGFDGDRGERIFTCPPVWSLYRGNGSLVIEIFHDLPGLGMERTLVLGPSPESADLYFSGASGRFTDPFFGPVLEILMVHHLARERGVILHGCGIVKGESGILFIGESGAGKSTLANLWQRETGIDALSDDRIIVRKEGGGLRMYGTPWHGEGRFASPGSARLERVFFLRHGRGNEVRRIGGAGALSQLLCCSFPPHWDAAGMGFTLDLFGSLASHVPCAELAFRPDGSAIAFLTDLLGD